MNANQVRARLGTEAKAAGSQRALAAKIGASTAYLSDVIRGKREPAGPILAYLQLERRVEYVKIAV